LFPKTWTNVGVLQNYCECGSPELKALMAPESVAECVYTLCTLPFRDCVQSQ